MRTHVIARKTHKWLGLFIGLQVVVWSLSGVYMTVVHIDTIHGDHLVRKAPSQGIDARGLQDPLALAAREKASGIAMAWLAVTGFWLLFRTMWRHDFVWLRARRTRQA